MILLFISPYCNRGDSYQGTKLVNGQLIESFLNGGIFVTRYHKGG